MLPENTLFIATIAIALLFDTVNGFHDAANSIATVVSTQVLKPMTAVAWAAFFNFVAMFLFAPHVADTLAQIVRIAPADHDYIVVICSGLLGAIAWDLLTWWLGLPTSSSHALIGGLSGAGIAHAGVDALRWDLLETTALFIVVAPLLGFTLGSALTVALYWLCRRSRPGTVDRRFRRGQLVSAALYSIGHGSNDAQKTMGVIIALLIAHGSLPPTAELSLFNADTLWIILACQLAMSLGTACGGWRIVKTMGMKITHLRPLSGFSAEMAGASTLFLATYSGIPVSTTHTITGAIIGVGSTTSSLSRIKWGVATRIVWAWILTLPFSALLGTLFYTLFIN